MRPEQSGGEGTQRGGEKKRGGKGGSITVGGAKLLSLGGLFTLQTLIV